MNILRSIACYYTVACLTFFTASSRLCADIIYSTPGSVYDQKFAPGFPAGGLPSASGSAWSNNSTINGWYAFNGTTPVTSITLSTGGTNVGGLLNYGLFSNGFPNDRALGSRATSGTIHMAAAFQNGASASLGSFTLTYNGEQWRKDVNANAQSLTFSYGFGNSFTNVGSWIDVPTLNFTSPIFNNNAASALNGDVLANSVRGITSTISGLNWQSNDTLWLRWTDIDDPGNDHGLAIDNILFSATAAPASAAVPEPSSMLLMSVVGIAGFGYRRLRRRSEGV